MLELPGMKTTGNPQADLENIRRYLSRLVPQLEMELLNANQDDYANEYNARAQNLGTGRSGTTAGALAEHVLDQRNPHKVTLAQLGFSYDKFVTIDPTDKGMVIRAGHKAGLQINLQRVTVQADVWNVVNQIRYIELELGEWERKLPVPMWVGATIASGGMDCWIGSVSGTLPETSGTTRITRLGPKWTPEPTPSPTPEEQETETAAQDGNVSDDGTDGTDEYDPDHEEEVRTITIDIIGVGVFGYGEE